MNYVDKKIISFFCFVTFFFILQGCRKMAVVSNVEISGFSDSIVLETDTFNTYKYKVSVLNEVILSDSAKGRKAFGLKDLLKRQIMDKYSLAYYLVNNNMKVPVGVLITNVKDTTLFVNFQYSSMQNVNANITGICAPLKCSNQDDKLWDNIRRWAYQHRKQMRNDILLRFRDVLFELNRTKYYEYVTNERVPIVNDLTNLKYKVQSDLKAKYYYLYATCSQNELDKFVEDMVVKNYPNSSLTGNGIFPCYANAGKSGYKCLTLIGINEDWSYSICPLGLIATDLRAPFIEDDFVNSLLGGNRYTFIDFKGNQRVKLPTNKPLIDGYAFVDVPNWDGNGVECNVTFRIKYLGDIKSVIIKRTASLCYHDGDYWGDLKPENKVIFVKGLRNPYVFTYKLHFENGDNIIPIIVEDWHGNKREGNIRISAQFVRTNSSDVNIENNINNNIYN